jgi:integral membrane protein
MNAPDLRDPVGRVRAVGMVEGVSFLLLMGVAMPLKYLADLPLAVTYVGWAHGVLFVAFVLVLFQAWAGGALSFGKSALALLAALLPLGPFLIDRKLAKSGHSPD